MAILRHELELITLAGIFTAPNFLDEFRDKLAEKLREEGWSVRPRSFFPYGDWTRKKCLQIAEITADLVIPSVGVRRFAKDWKREERGVGEGCNEPVFVLIGHSGGGVAAVHAAAELHREGQRIGGVGMIGSPKMPIPLPLRDKTLYVQAVDPSGRRTDPITTFGAWRGKPPGISLHAEIIGGHPDYFRSREPYVNREGRSNLAVMLDVLVPWLLQRLNDL